MCARWSRSSRANAGILPGRIARGGAGIAHVAPVRLRPNCLGEHLPWLDPRTPRRGSRSTRLHGKSRSTTRQSARDPVWPSRDFPRRRHFRVDFDCSVEGSKGFLVPAEPVQRVPFVVPGYSVLGVEFIARPKAARASSYRPRSSKSGPLVVPGVRVPRIELDRSVEGGPGRPSVVRCCSARCPCCAMRSRTPDLVRLPGRRQPGPPRSAPNDVTNTPCCSSDSV